MKLKTLFLLTAILLLGVAIGFLSAGYLMRERVKNFNGLQNQVRIEKQIFSILDLPAIEEEKIETDVKDFTSSYLYLRKNSRMEMRRKADSLHQILFQKLDSNQIEKLKANSRIFKPIGRRKHDQD